MNGGDILKTTGEEKEDPPFSSISTVHGLDKVVSPGPYPKRRWIWSVIILASLCAFTYQATLRLLYFLERPVTMNFLVVNNQSIIFPTVVICNQNTFRLTAAAKNNWFYLLDDMYSRENLSTFNPDVYGAGNISLEYLYSETAHRKEDLIISCEWNKEPCSTDDFQEMYTDYGVCYAFNPPGKTKKQLTQTGAENGLSLNLNIEQYEYMKGPHRAAGLKILLYGHNEAPFVNDLGDALPTGMDAFISVNTELTTSLPPPYGECYQQANYSQSTCLELCRTKYATKFCACRHFFMTELEPGFPPVCTLKQYTTCLWNVMENFNTKEHCDCPNACDSSTFKTLITYASTPTQNVFTGTVNDSALAESYLEARETAQKSFTSIIIEDRQLVESVLHTFTLVGNAIEDIMAALDNLNQGEAMFLNNIQPRLLFHYDWGLDRVQYIMQNNFVRLWDVVDERTFTHVMTGFYQTTALYRIMVNMSMDQEATQSKREIWYEMTDRDLLKRINLCERAFDNLTTLDAGFSYGIPAFTYQATPRRHYDEKYIPYDILRESSSKTLYFNRWSGYLTDAITQLETLRTINNDIFINRSYNGQEMETALLTYEQRGRNHLYYRYLYYSRIVLPTLQLTIDKAEYFKKLNETLFADLESLKISFENIRRLIQNFNETSGENIIKGVKIAEEYLLGDEQKKYTVANFVNSEKTSQDLSSFNILFKDLRTRALQILDRWASLEKSYLAIYMDMVNESWTQPLYEAIQGDFQTYMYNESTYLANIWRRMLGYPITNLTYNELKMMINADVYGMNYTSVQEELSSKFKQLITDNNIVDIIGDNAEHFVRAFEQMQIALSRYMETTVLDAKFYSHNFLRVNIFNKELKYSHMVYQKAYDIMALLSDIGGTLSLWIGASAITLFEVLDAILLHLIVKRVTN